MHVLKEEDNTLREYYQEKSLVRPGPLSVHPCQMLYMPGGTV